ncbi:MAG TPA: class I SAM-dependent methyltransferase [Acidiferrobacteraceae bacterium]|nr:class I SAM-dependent methyltransferase [Acidiferrobacteraceae bacterium]
MKRILKKLLNLTSTEGDSDSDARLGRQLYKGVWTDLSKTEGQAKLWVQGTEDEKQLDESAKDTLNKLQQTVGISKKDDVLEIGCGVGRVGSVLAPLCNNWTGCDVSPNMLQYAAQRLKNYSNINFVEVSGYDLQPIEDSSVDMVYSTVVFMHLSEWDRYNYVEDAWRVLKEGGRLYIDNISLTTDTGWEFFQSSRAIAPAERPPQIGQTSTPDEFRVYLEKAGYQNIHVEVIHDAWVIGWAEKSG